MNPLRALAATALCLASPTALAQEPLGSVEAGRALAFTVCAECHDVGRVPEQDLLFEGDPPPFRMVADDPAVTPLSLSVFLRTPHRNMPNIMLTQQESDDVIAYILSLRD